jgi:transcriptional regulator with XRE-family HTH domain
MDSREMQSLADDAIKSVGRVVAEYRARHGQVLNQEKLAEAVKTTRTKIAFLEEGRELPDAELLTRICEHLKIPPAEWLAATHEHFAKGAIFHRLACELTGRHVSMKDHTATDQLIALDRIKTLFGGSLTPIQAHAQMNSWLVFYGERPLTRSFFDHYLGLDAFESNGSFLKKLRLYQVDAMLLYGNFRRAFIQLSRIENLQGELAVRKPEKLDGFATRTRFDSIREIAPERLADLGYIAAQALESQNRERSELSDALKALAKEVESNGATAVQDIPERKLRRIRTLLRRFDSTLTLEHSLYATLDHVTLQQEAEKVAPEREDLVRIAQTQMAGLRNLGVYLSEPYMDVYVATSMREKADFQSVNSFVQSLFSEPELTGLNLRYFNPTQSWIEDRVSKGLVEALMLRRATVTVYMAQKGDTFGKDSEASVALGQGKAVIVYVPRLYSPADGVDSEAVFNLDDRQLDEQLSKLDIVLEEELDKKEKARLVLREVLTRLPPNSFKALLRQHWADFDLASEAKRVDNEHLRAAIVESITNIASTKDLETVVVEETVRRELVDRLVSASDRFESRAKIFKETHPLALQVIVRSGVVNGILVTRAIPDCARLLKGVVSNSLEFDIEVDKSNYRLVERYTRSTLRVVSRHRLLTFAFWSQYFEEKALTIPQHELPVSIL